VVARYLYPGELAREGGEWAGAPELGPLEDERESNTNRARASRLRRFCWQLPAPQARRT
jgi:hypothetical protein